ncbi:MAG: hypothetical protein Fur009_6720 [Candidatus Microgenomates bacterium]
MLRLKKLNNFFLNIIIVCFFIGFVLDLINSYFNALYFNEFALDGAFQFFNGLIRIDKFGTTKPLYLFHGLGLYLINYPLFKFLGGDLLASEIIRYLFSPILFVLSNIIFLRFFNFSYKLIFLIIFLFYFVFTNLFGLYELIYPSGSLLSIRSSTTIIILSIMGFIIIGKRKYELKLKDIFYLSILSGFIWFFSNDQGLYVVLAVFLTILLFIKSFKSIIYICLTFLIYLTFIFLFYKGNLINIKESVIYNLFSIPKNQIWYFGLPPQKYLSNILWFFADWGLVFRIGFLILNTSIIFTLCKRFKFLERYYLFLIILFFYSLLASLSTLAIVSQYYLSVTLRIQLLILISILLLINPLKLKFLNFLKRNNQILFIGIFSFLILQFLSFSFIRYKEIKEHLFLIKNFRLIKLNKLYLSKDWLETFEKLDKYLINNSFWITYGGLVNLKYNQFQPNFDYIIHALSLREKKLYLESFRNKNPTFVITIKPSYSIFYEWLWKENWYFYREIFEKYTPIDYTNHYIVWKKNKTLRKKIEINTIKKISQKELFFKLPSQCKTFCFFELEFKYNYKGIFKNFFRPIIYSSNYGFFDSQIGLNPFEKNFSFPLIINFENYPNDRIVKLQARIEPKIIFIENPFSNLKIESANIYNFNFNNDELRILFNGFSFLDKIK